MPSVAGTPATKRQEAKYLQTADREQHLEDTEAGTTSRGAYRAREATCAVGRCHDSTIIEWHWLPGQSSQSPTGR